MLLRGFPTRASEQIVTISSPTDRFPVNMPLCVQLEIDNWFEAKFGVRFRQRSLFCTGSIEVARGYTHMVGEVRTLRAVEDFCFCWSPLCDDLYGAYETSSHNESIGELLSRLQFRCDDLISAIRSQNEIMLVCSRVQAIRQPGIDE